MKPLLLSGFGISIGVDKRKLMINKRQNNETIEFYPHQIPYDSVIIDGHYGLISFEALRWLSKHGITLSLLNWNGNLLSVTLPNEPISGKLKIKQYETYKNNIKRYEIAFTIIKTKIEKSKELLITLSDYYNKLKKDEIIKNFNKELENLKNFNENFKKITLSDAKNDKNVLKYNQKSEKLKEKNLKIKNDFLKNLKIKNDFNKFLNKNSAKPVEDIENNTSEKEKIRNLMAYEGRIADYYWKTLSTVFNSLYPEFSFKSRKNKSYSWNMNASDYVNALLNYGYAILESIIRRDINIIGLDTNIGFLHEINPSKQPLVYDLQELYRWLIDLSVIQLLEEKKISKSDFIFTENYHIRLRESAAKLLLEKIMLNFNKRADFERKMHSYDNILLKNIRILANYIEKDSKELEFDIPSIKIDREDSVELRNQIMSIMPEERKRLGINKSTLWYQQKAIREERKIKIYTKKD